MKITGTVHNGNIFKNVHNALGKDDSRPVMMEAYVKDGCIYATDAHLGIKIPLKLYGINEEDSANLEGKCFHADDIKQLGAIKPKDKWFIDAEGFNFLRDGKVKSKMILHESEYKAPDLDAVMPKNFYPLQRIKIDPKKISVVQDIYSHTNPGEGEKVLYMEFVAENRAIAFKNSEGLMVAMVMPMMIN
jgi:hypothetical protein